MCQNLPSMQNNVFIWFSRLFCFFYEMWCIKRVLDALFRDYKYRINKFDCILWALWFYRGKFQATREMYELIQKTKKKTLEIVAHLQIDQRSLVR